MAWFEDWFDSKYYHILYKNRDLDEASKLIDNLVKYLAPEEKASMLDLGCGKGRHSLYLAKKGFQVTGIDLSIPSIKHARQFEQENLSFYSHDMRQLFRSNYYDYIFNFFTSFGYFQQDREHLNALVNARKGLTKGGIFGIDFFNTTYILDHLVAEEEKLVDGIRFKITRSLQSGFIVKNIQFEAEGRTLEFEERVRAFSKEDLYGLLKQAGLEPLTSFGDYDLNPFKESESSRLIILAKKI